MTYKYLQLNIEGGKRLKSIIDYIEREDFDVVGLQEVSGGDMFQLQRLKQGHAEVEDDYRENDCFAELLNSLPHMNGELDKVREYDKDGENYLGNAILYKKSIKLLGRDTIVMNKADGLAVHGGDPVDANYSTLSTKLEVGDGKQIAFLAGHFTWAPRPYDTDASIGRAKKVKDYLQDLQMPFLLSGDFNLDSNTITCMQFEDISNNLVRSLGVRNTLNPRLHRVPALFPEGIACDQLFVSPEVTPISFSVVREDLSDHYGLAVEFKVADKKTMPIGGVEVV
jgi:endonuclease/exonuclease/phosphatase family metal-dependent hydrolase